MAINCFGLYFSFGKFRFSALVELVSNLAGNFDFGRALHDEKERRG